MRVTYLLEPCFWLELAMADDLEEWLEVERSAVCGDANYRQPSEKHFSTKTRDAILNRRTKLLRYTH
jgi:hypothetical protein